MLPEEEFKKKILNKTAMIQMKLYQLCENGRARFVPQFGLRG